MTALNPAACPDGTVICEWSARPKDSGEHGCAGLVNSTGEITGNAGHRICLIRNRYRTARLARDALDAVVSGRVPGSMEILAGNRNAGIRPEIGTVSSLGAARVVWLLDPIAVGPSGDMSCMWLVSWVHGNELRIAYGDDGESTLLLCERSIRSSAISKWEDRASPGLLWRGRLVDGAVCTTAIALSADRAAGIPKNGLPLTISRWNPRYPNIGYACKYPILQRSGEVVSAGDVEGNYSETVPDLVRGGWYLFMDSPAVDDTSSQFSVIDVEGGIGNKRQFTTDLYAIADDAGTHIFDARTGRLHLLDGEVRLGEIIAADNGNIALNGDHLPDYYDIVRVYDSQGRMLYEHESESNMESIRYLNMNAAGTFVEFNKVVSRSGTSRSRDVRRIRVDLCSGHEHEVEMPLGDGMLIGRGHDAAVWTRRSSTLIQHLDQAGKWRQVASIPQRASVGEVLPDGSVVLDLVVIEGFRDEIVLYKPGGTSRGLLTGVINTFDICHYGDGILVVYGIDQTVVLTTQP